MLEPPAIELFGEYFAVFGATEESGLNQHACTVTHFCGMIYSYRERAIIMALYDFGQYVTRPPTRPPQDANSVYFDSAG